MVLPVGSTVSLVIQLVILVLFVVALVLKKRQKFRQHGMTMLSAVVLHLVSILAVMIPSFQAFVSVPSEVNLADSTVVVTFVHVFAGVLAALLGVWLVASWHLQKNLQPCFKKKRFMDGTLTVWLLAIVLGVFLYLKIAQVI